VLPSSVFQSQSIHRPPDLWHWHLQIIANLAGKEIKDLSMTKHRRRFSGVSDAGYRKNQAILQKSMPIAPSLPSNAISCFFDFALLS